MMEEAIASFKKAVEANPYDLGAYNNLGAACGNIGNKACALGAFKRALIIAPGSADAHFNIAVFYYKNGQPTQAAEHFKKAIRLGYRVPDEYIKTLGLNQK
jgi:Flp pilus assembly protein TadD